MSFQECYMNGIIQYNFLGLSFSTQHDSWRFIELLCVSVVCYFLLLSNVNTFNHSPVDGHLEF